MSYLYRFAFLLIFILFLTLSLETQMKAQKVPLAWMKDSQVKLKKELTVRYGESQQTRIQQGLNQVADFSPVNIRQIHLFPH